MIFRSGLTSAVSDTYIPPSDSLQPASSPLVVPSPTNSTLLTYAIVTDIILDNSNLELFDANGKLAGIGTIFFNGSEKAQPLFPNIKVYPMVGETVIIIKGIEDQQPVLGTNKVLPSISRNYYITPINFFSNPHYNPTPSSNPQTFSNVDLQYFLKQNINPLLPFAGDVIHEGRFGNSIRLGNTSKTKSPLSNTWQSDSGENGDPITIIRNGQNPQIQTPFIPITEDINNDLSSLYLTSTQKIPLGLANENFNSYTSLPTTPASYNNPQIILNSNRVIINAKNDHILISGEKSVGISSNNSINIESKQIYLDGNDIRLGNKNATQSVLKGDDAVAYLKILINELKNITEALKTVTNWPEGSPVPNSTVLTVANSAQKIFENVYNNIDSIKSNFVKTI